MVVKINKKLTKEILDKMITVKEGAIMLSDIDYAVHEFMFEDTHKEVYLQYVGLVDDTVVYADVGEVGNWCAVRFRPERDPDLLDVYIKATVESISDTELGEINKLSMDLHIKRKKVMKW